MVILTRIRKPIPCCNHFLLFSESSLSFILQVVWAAADAGLSLADVAAEAKHASEAVGTMGVALSVCTLPGQVTSDRLGPEQIELGLGIVSLDRTNNCYFSEKFLNILSVSLDLVGSVSHVIQSH